MKQTLTFERLEQLLIALKQVPSILVLGDLGIDKYTEGEVSRISPEAPVPVLEVQREWKKLGLAANVCDNLQALGVKSSVCGVVGDDHHGDLLLSMLDHFHLPTIGVLKVADRMTTFKERVITQVQQICRIDYETKGPIQEAESRKIFSRLENMSVSSSALIIEDYGKGLLDKWLVQEAMNLFRSQGKLVAVDPSRNTPAHFYRGAQLLKPNWIEAKAMAQQLGANNVDKMSIEQMGEFLLKELALENLVLTLGAQGMAIFARDQGPSKRIPTKAMEVFDVSGAGDTVIALLTAALVAGATIDEAAWIANLAAGIVVGKKGTATITAEELKSYYHQH